jgi:hypothetical protein
MARPIGYKERERIAIRLTKQNAIALYFVNA